VDWQAAPISLQNQHGRLLAGVWIILDNNSRVDPSQHVFQQNIICG
jgi:hypothetical protein